jgi:hypothetical protein
MFVKKWFQSNINQTLKPLFNQTTLACTGACDREHTVDHTSDQLHARNYARGCMDTRAARYLRIAPVTKCLNWPTATRAHAPRHTDPRACADWPAGPPPSDGGRLRRRRPGPG